MQQTADVVVETKDQTDVESDSETTLVSGSYYSFCAAAETDVADSAVAMTAACGSSSYYSAVADVATTEVTAVDATTTAATKIEPTKKSLGLLGPGLFVFREHGRHHLYCAVYLLLFLLRFPLF